MSGANPGEHSGEEMGVRPISLWRESSGVDRRGALRALELCQVAAARVAGSQVAVAEDSSHAQHTHAVKAQSATGVGQWREGARVVQEQVAVVPVREQSLCALGTWVGRGSRGARGWSAREAVVSG